MTGAIEHFRTGIDLTNYVSTKSLRDVDGIKEAFVTAEPFPHVVIDDFLRDDFASRLLADFPKRDSEYEKFCIGEDGKPSGNYSNHDTAAFPPAFGDLDRLIADPGFLTLLGEMTGIPQLEYDAEYYGGGIRESSNRQFLPPHIDFNHHPSRLIHRRLNLLLYLNPGWKEEWGGNLQVHRDPRVNAQSMVRSYAPIFNRCLIFETSEISWHGFDRLTPPPGRSRRAFTVYFYTKDRPNGENIGLHSTEYVEPPLPLHLVEGYMLTGEDVAGLREAFARRDGRIAMLYAMRREFDARYKHLWREYEYYLHAWEGLRREKDPDAGV